ncbi:hypothetical protein [Thermococcus celer]|uniref:Uncharacterized protein n=1 Tax=Thermococcus celer Vu 13 = JCM 8558 TaxID=1293037 RepID=A0A218P1V6_THECE|nr:hypothetical protein [Thermococcus celer]ASI98897.1 hypothetical protein A3L02_04645 [Thermococcus celer Vu 13 = JCM 8558]
MGRDAVLDEIDRRIKRLQAEIDIAEERLRYLEEVGSPSRYNVIRRDDYSLYYLVLMGIWILLGFLSLIAVGHRLPYSFNLPVLPYLLVTLVVIVLSVAYYWLGRRAEPKTPMDELEERERLARLVLSRFYKPLREAVEKDDREAMEALAEELLNDSLLAGAVERMGEGDPKVMAYSLYLYTRFRPELEGEVREALSSLGNGPMRALLSGLIEG